MARPPPLSVKLVAPIDEGADRTCHVRRPAGRNGAVGETRICKSSDLGKVMGCRGMNGWGDEAEWAPTQPRHVGK